MDVLYAHPAPPRQSRFAAHFHFPIFPPPAIYRRMKTLFQLVLLLAVAFAFTACETDMPPEPKTEGPLVRGLTGQGTVVPIDKRDDPMINHAPGVAN
jgi:hypothetical protein